jgi:O-antigen ligase
LALLLIVYRDLVFSRFFALDTPIESQSITQRFHDAALAVDVIRRNPLNGVGLGYYIDAAQQLDPQAARVHNVGLLVMAELGLAGLFFWLWLMLAPFWLLLREWWKLPSAEGSFRYSHVAAQLAPWVAMLVANTFDTMLWLSSNWQTSILFAMIIANVVSQIGVVEPTSDIGRFPTAVQSPKISSTSATKS